MIPLILLADAAPQAVERSDGAQMIPEAIRAMLDAAIASGNDGDVSTIVRYARSADPVSGDAVLAIAEKWRADRAAAREAVIRQASFLNLWTGRAELGGFATTGNADTAGVTAILSAQREGLRWRHKFLAQVDYQESLGVTARERYQLSYEPNYKIDDRAYVYGSSQYESDRFLGFDDRVSLSAGLGYSAVRSPRMQLDIDLGPAFRHTEFTDDRVESSIAGRGTIDFRWRLTDALSLTQRAEAFVQQFNSTANGTTAVNAKLLGPLSARFSYDVRFESQPPAGRRTTDTTTRASLVYSF